MSLYFTFVQAYNYKINKTIRKLYTFEVIKYSLLNFNITFQLNTLSMVGGMFK